MWDTGRTDKTATSTLTAVITRNENKPRFDRYDYTATINDRYKLGQEVTTISASDQDKVCNNAYLDIVFYFNFVLTVHTEEDIKNDIKPTADYHGI